MSYCLSVLITEQILLAINQPQRQNEHRNEQTYSQDGASSPWQYFIVSLKTKYGQQRERDIQASGHCQLLSVSFDKACNFPTYSNKSLTFSSLSTDWMCLKEIRVHSISLSLACIFCLCIPIVGNRCSKMNINQYFFPFSSIFSPLHLRISWQTASMPGSLVLCHTFEHQKAARMGDSLSSFFAVFAAKVW